MIDRRSICLVCFVAVLLLAAPLPPACAQEAVFPLVEDYIVAGKLGQYIKDAMAYLRKYPSSRFAPRVAFDLMLIGQRTKKPKLVEDMRAYLVMDRPRSLQTSYVVAQFKKPAEFRQFVNKRMSVVFKKHPHLVPQSFIRAVEAGLGHFQAKLLDNTSFLLRTYCMAHIAGADKLSGSTLPVLRERIADSPELLAVLNTYTDDKLSMSQKVARLHNMRKQGDAKFLKRALLGQLSKDEKKKPDIVRTVVENAIGMRKYEDALSFGAAMPPAMRDEPQVMFWKAWTLFGLEKDAPAIEQLAELRKAHPKSEWASIAETYVDGIGHFGRRQKASADAILAVTRKARQGIGVFEARFTHKKENDDGETEVLNAYLGMVPGDDRFEMALHRNGRMSLGYHTSRTKAAFLVRSEAKTLKYTEPGPIPTPIVEVNRSPEGGFHVGAGLGMSTSMESAGRKASSAIRSPYLSTPEGLQELLDYTTRRQGWVPAEPVEKDGVTSYVWLIPATETPKLERLEFRVSGNSLVYVEFDTFRLDSARYERKKSFDLAPPEWPKREAEMKDEFEPGTMFRLLGAVAEWFGMTE